MEVAKWIEFKGVTNQGCLMKGQLYAVRFHNLDEVFIGMWYGSNCGGWVFQEPRGSITSKAGGISHVIPLEHFKEGQGDGFSV